MLALPGSDDALLRGERLSLRAVQPEDFPVFAAGAALSEELHATWSGMPGTREHFDGYLAIAARENCRSFLLCRNDDRALLGVITLSEIVRGLLQSAYLAYYAVTPFTRQGYLTEGLELVLRYTFETLELHRVEANIQPGNLPSIALVRKCGFEREGLARNLLKVRGTWQDHERWAMREELWRERGPLP